MSNARNLINCERISKAFGERPLLDSVSLGVNVGDRIGVVGRNGAGKSTLLEILAGVAMPDSGRVSVAADTRIGYLGQLPNTPPGRTISEEIVGNRPAHEWVTDPQVRTVLDELLGGHDLELMNRRLDQLSGGERRRVDIARLLISDVDVLLLDEPTNHLDVEVIAWLASFLKERSNLAVIVVTHDRWFLDDVCESMWEVVGGQVEEYDGGYSAYVLSKNERMRQAAASEARRQNLLRKELAWLRRGAPARTSKPKFRIDVANELIKTEPPPRDDVELLAFANARLGKTVIEAHDARVAIGDRVLLDHLNWNIGPGQRLGLLGPNGVGKTTLLRVLVGESPPSGGKVVIGPTVKIAYLSQTLAELKPEQRVIESVREVAERVDLGKGRELTASQLCERLGFGSDGQWTPVKDLSGGERRRLQLTRLLMSAPNVLVLDEPTNDFDVETLSALEDLLDGFAGTILVVSHDRYFLERVCDDFYAVLGDYDVVNLPGGVDEYVRRRSLMSAPASESKPETAMSSASAERAAGKLMAKLERQIAKLTEQEAELHASLAEHATDYEKVAELNKELTQLQSKREQLEEDWLNAAD